MKHLFFSFVFFAFTSLALFSQSSVGADPDVLFKGGDYVGALAEYLKLEKKTPDDPHLKHQIGLCYLNIHDDKSKAGPYLMYCFNKGFGGNQIALEAGMALQYANDLKGAEFCYKQYRTNANTKEKEMVDHLIETCLNAKELMKHPVAVKFENLGKEVNTRYPDYYPFVTKNEGTLYFTSRRQGSVGNQISAAGYFSADIYYSKVNKGQWTTAKNMGPLFNTKEDEECVAITSDGKKMIVYVYHDDTGSDLFYAEYPAKGKAFARPVGFLEPVNTDAAELEACFNTEATMLFFVSDRKGGHGEADIYCSKLLPTLEWGEPVNLGENINTKYKEGFPQISEDGQTLYFASQGHTSMGGFDIFKSQWDSINKTWGKPVNIGYPVNTTDDDMMFSLAGRGRDGYISACKKGGFGDLDIYKVIFTDVEEPYTAIRGWVRSIDSTKTELETFISITNLETKTEVDAKDINHKTGRYIFIVSPGKYRIDVKSVGHQDISAEVIVYDKSDFAGEIEKNITVLPVGYVPPKLPPKKK
ncbi:MAG: PD40 domain-containing protein [Bacteroidia bacterium]|nr:PD40 domain-containing protein [Bacteroidia bacterium]